MNTAPTIQRVGAAELLASVTQLKAAGWRLVQIGATRLPDAVELTYSFDRNLELTNLRVNLASASARVPSISPVYWCAFPYENEIHDLFNVQVEGMAVDFHGTFYQTTIPFPFAVQPKSKPPTAANPALKPLPGSAMGAAGSPPLQPAAPDPAPSGRNPNAPTA